MESNEILQQVNDVFKTVFENDKIIINMETTANDLEEWNSFNHTIMIAEVEKHFGITFKLKEMLGFKNVGDMVRVIESKQKGV